MAGELGFEPRSSVLETDSLTVELTPPGGVRFGDTRFVNISHLRTSNLYALLGLFVVRVLAARVAELGELQTAGRGLLVLGCGVVPVLALRALQCDDLAHGILPFEFGQPPRLASSLRSSQSSDRATRRDAGLRPLQPCS